MGIRSALEKHFAKSRASPAVTASVIFGESGMIKPLSPSKTVDGYMLITVQDTGQGVAEEDLPKMFLEFVQVGPHQTKGTGLGLPISQRFIKMHGGELWAESELGVGSTFFIKLPISAPLS